MTRVADETRTLDRCHRRRDRTHTSLRSLLALTVIEGVLIAELLHLELRDVLQQLPDWTAEHISVAISTYCTAQGLSMGQIGQPLRAALTGGLPAPDIAPVLEWLGRDEALGRIEDQLAPD